MGAGDREFESHHSDHYEYTMLENRFLLNTAEPMQDDLLRMRRTEVEYGLVPLPRTTYSSFISHFHDWITQSQNDLRGFNKFEREVCVGTTHFIDNLIMLHGLENLQIFEHDYIYYRKLMPGKQWAILGELKEKQPLLIALPFPGYGAIHPLMDSILNECLSKQIPVHIDGCWMSCAKGIEFDFSHPAIHSVAFSLSKGLDLGWNRIGVRYSKQINHNDSITIVNNSNMINTMNVKVGELFMKQFPADYLWKKYGNIYHKVCKRWLIKPTNCIHMGRRFDTGAVVGLRRAIEEYHD